jgi:cytochrome c oxidase subunit II
MRKLSRVVLVLAILGLAVLVPSVAAKDSWFFPDAKSQTQREWQALFTKVFWAALVVFILVEGLLLYALLRFRRRKNGPQEGPHIHGNTKMEIAWTIAPTLVMAWLLVVSLQQLDRVDHGPEPDFTIDVVGHQFYFEFFYPPTYVNSTKGKLYVEEGKIVGLRVTSEDVIHAYNIPQLSVMIDAVPGRTNHVWFQADEAGQYKFQCRELCGVGHGAMNGTVVVFPAGSQDVPYGEAPKEPEPVPTNGTAPTPTNSSAPAADTEQVVELSEFTITPLQHTTDPGQTLALHVKNNGKLAHNLYIGTFGGEVLWKTADLNGGQQEDLVLELPEAADAWEWWCNVPGHKESGMYGTLSTGGEAEGGKKPILPGPGPLLVVLVLLGAVVVLRARRN